MAAIEEPYKLTGGDISRGHARLSSHRHTHSLHKLFFSLHEEDGVYVWEGRPLL